MNIRPISQVSYNNKIDFTSRKNKQQKADNTTNTSSPLKKVPLMVMLAMSPMVMPLSASAQNSNNVTLGMQVTNMRFIGLEPIETKDKDETIYFQKKQRNHNKTNKCERQHRYYRR